jgi:hypothetical protein
MTCENIRIPPQGCCFRKRNSRDLDTEAFTTGFSGKPAPGTSGRKPGHDGSWAVRAYNAGTAGLFPQIGHGAMPNLSAAS